MPESSAIILCYHKVGPEREEGRFLNIEPDRLASHIRFFQRRGYPFLLGGEYAKKWPGRSVCLTFDDAYLSAMTYGRETMLRLGVRGTFYVVSSLVGIASNWDGEIARPLAPESLLVEALSQGFELGNHTHTHPHLNELEDRGRAELAACRAYLRGLGVSQESFCYPYGALDQDVAHAVGESGYSVGMALGKRPARESDGRLQLPRTVIAFSHSLPMLVYKLFVRPKLPA